jgi:hypothetical protein
LAVPIGDNAHNQPLHLPCIPKSTLPSVRLFQPSEPVGVRYTAGHSVACVDGVLTVTELVKRVER